LDIAGFEIFDVSFTLHLFYMTNLLNTFTYRRSSLLLYLYLSLFKVLKLQFNSFEQLWINFVNEKLQQFFNHHMFVLEQEEYAREGIEWKFIDFGLDLQACIELIEKPMGIISMLDEECIVPKATDTTLAQKLNEQHLGKHPNFEKPKPPKGKQAEAHFAMRHYAGLVRYNVMNWLEKNKDPLNDTVAACLKASKGNALLNEIWADYMTQEEASNMAKSTAKKKGKSGSFMTVSMVYRESLNNLMTMLYKTHPHFIRCIIPNEKKKSGLLDAALVLNQLTCNGVLEGIRICRKGFPNRTLFPDYVQRYSILGADEAQSSSDPKQCAIKMLNRLVKEGAIKEEMYRIGLTKVFFKAGILAHLEDLRDEKLNYLITGLQAQIRQYFTTIDLKQRRMRFAAMKSLQRNISCWIRIINWPWLRLTIDVIPTVRESKLEEILQQMRIDMIECERRVERKHNENNDIELQLSKVIDDRRIILEEINNSKTDNTEAEHRIEELIVIKDNLEKMLSDKNEKLEIELNRTENFIIETKKLEQQIENLHKSMQDIEINKRKSETAKSAKEIQIRSLVEEIDQQQQTFSKLNKERKYQNEMSKKIQSQIGEQEERNAQNARVCVKLEQIIKELEEALHNEQHRRTDTDRSRRKAENDLKKAKETFDELSDQKNDLEKRTKSKDTELQAIDVRLMDAQANVARLVMISKDSERRINELEQELKTVREVRIKSDHAQTDLERQLHEINVHLEEQRKVTTIQMEKGKKHDSDIAQLCRDLQQAKIMQESRSAVMQKKGSDGVTELNNQILEMRKLKSKVEMECRELQKQVEDTTAHIDIVVKARVEQERANKAMEVRIYDLQTKCEEYSKQLQQLTSLRSRMIIENNELSDRVEQLEEQLATVTKAKSQCVSNLEAAKQTAEDESHERQKVSSNVRHLQHEVEQLRGLLDDEFDGKDDLKRQLSRAEAEIQEWKVKIEQQGFLPAGKLEDVKRKQTSTILELEQALDAANCKLIALEKIKSRLSMDAEEANTELQKHIAIVDELHRKQKIFEKIVAEWKKKIDNANNELEFVQNNCRQLSADLYKEKTNNDNLNMQRGSLQYENNQLNKEIDILHKQLSESDNSVRKIQSIIQSLEGRKDGLKRALDEAEANLEAEESKVSRIQIEITQIRAEIEKKMFEKEEEFENARKTHQQLLDSIEATIESEKMEKTELLRLKCKLELDVSDLERSLAHANEANEEAQSNMKRYMTQIAEMRTVIAEEQICREKFQNDLFSVEKKLAKAMSEKEDAIVKQLQVPKLSNNNKGFST
uniref:Myosin motor domain-containing protein n=1 Tax=Toxocara canis TaxID=6265 RepID=A0A183U179_TOXCA